MLFGPIGQHNAEIKDINNPVATYIIRAYGLFPIRKQNAKVKHAHFAVSVEIASKEY